MNEFHHGMDPGPKMAHFPTSFPEMNDQLVFFFPLSDKASVSWPNLRKSPTADNMWVHAPLSVGAQGWPGLNPGIVCGGAYAQAIHCWGFPSGWHPGQAAHHVQSSAVSSASEEPVKGEHPFWLLSSITSRSSIVQNLPYSECFDVAVLAETLLSLAGAH